MQCPWCAALEDRVVDSREIECGVAVRRRRECLSCTRRFTTYERAAVVGLVVRKRSGAQEHFAREKLIAGIRAACKNRPIGERRIEILVDDVEEQVFGFGPEVTAEQIGVAVLDRLGDLDQVAYMRFASVYKGFTDADDFAREVGLLSETTFPASEAMTRTRVVKLEEN